MSRDQIEKDAEVISLRMLLAACKFVLLDDPQNSLIIVKRNRCQQALDKRIELLKERKEPCD